MRWAEDSFRSAIIASKSIRQVLSLLGLKESGGNYITAKKTIERLGLDISHFHGKGWRKNKSFSPKRSLQEILVDNRHENTYRLKNRLLRENLKDHRCERCGLEDWLTMAIPLELHHIDGNRKNNKLDNLSLLCPNCHALTDNYRGKNRKV